MPSAPNIGMKKLSANRNKSPDRRFTCCEGGIMLCSATVLIRQAAMCIKDTTIAVATCRRFDSAAANASSSMKSPPAHRNRPLAMAPGWRTGLIAEAAMRPFCSSRDMDLTRLPQGAQLVLRLAGAVDKDLMRAHARFAERLAVAILTVAIEPRQ